jgi:hypothetical protein
MIDIRTGKCLKDFPILEEPKTYIYVMLNDAGKVKIGKTKNIYQRYLSLCGSNSQGININKVCCSPATYLHTLENIMHSKFNTYRITNTEWFNDKDDVTGENLFANVIEELRLLFSSTEYKKCNKIRKELHEKQLLKGGDKIDN